MGGAAAPGSSSMIMQPRSSTSSTATAKKLPGIYTVVKCGPSGHNIRCAPSLNAVPIGMLSLNDNITVCDVKDTPAGECWVKIERDSAEKFCFGMVDGDLWSLAVSNTDIHYLQEIYYLKIQSVFDYLIDLQEDTVSAEALPLRVGPNINEFNAS